MIFNCIDAIMPLRCKIKKRRLGLVKSIVTTTVFIGLGFAGGLAVNSWPSPQGALAGEDAQFFVPWSLCEKPVAAAETTGAARTQRFTESSMRSQPRSVAPLRPSSSPHDRIIYDPENYIPPPRPEAHIGVDLTHVVDP